MAVSRRRILLGIGVVVLLGGLALVFWGRETGNHGLLGGLGGVVLIMISAAYLCVRLVEWVLGKVRPERRRKTWYTHADRLLRSHLILLADRQMTSGTLTGLPFDRAYVRHAQHIAGRDYTVSLGPPSSPDGDPDLVVTRP